MRKDYDNGYYEGNVTCKGKRLGRGKRYFDDGSSYSGTFTGDAYNGFGWYYFANGNKYFGQWENGSRTGYGVLTYANGDKYYGYWYNDKRQGFGVVFYNDGRVFVGDWVDGKKDGKGYFSYNDGSHLVCRYSQDEIHGKCKRVLSDGSWRYELWENGEMKSSTEAVRGVEPTDIGGEYSICCVSDDYDDEDAGETTYYGGGLFDTDEPKFAMITYSNGDYYFGLARNGAPNGVGYYRFADQSYCYGSYIDGERNGYCTYSSKEIKYYGGFKDDGRSGFGVSFYGDGKVHFGQYLNGEAHGEGGIYLPNDGMYSGYFSNGSCSNLQRSLYLKSSILTECVPFTETKGYTVWNGGDAMLFDYTGRENMGDLAVFEDGSVSYRNVGGEIQLLRKDGVERRFLPNGKGYMRDGNIYVYYGDLVNGAKTGKGTLYFGNGNNYQGELVDGVFNGKGIFTYCDGTVYRGMFRNGQQCGEGTLYFIDGAEAYGSWIDDNNSDYLEVTIFGRKQLCKMVDGELLPY